MTVRVLVLMAGCLAAFGVVIGSAGALDEESVRGVTGAMVADGIQPGEQQTILATIEDVSRDGLRLTVKRVELLPRDEMGEPSGAATLAIAARAEVLTASGRTRLVDRSGQLRPIGDLRIDGATLYRIEMAGETVSRLTEYVPKRRVGTSSAPTVAAIPAPLDLPLIDIPPLGRSPRPYFATNAPQVALLNPIASQPQAVKRGTKTYIAYEGPGRDPYVACWDEALQTWDGPYRAGTNPQTWDTHGGPALFVDDRGNVHVFFGSHHQPLLHARTFSPGRIDSWISLPAVQGETTYPKVARTGTGPILLYRDRTSRRPETSLHWVYRESKNDGDAWGDEIELLSMAYPLSVYPTIAERPDGSVDLSWVDVDWLEYFSGSWSRYNVYYARRTPSGSWENGFGEPLSLPIDRTTAAEKCLVLNSGTEFTNQTMPGVGPDGCPRILFTQGNDGPGTPYRFRFARAAEGTWTVSDISPTDHFYDSAAWYQQDDGFTAYLTTGGAGADGAEPNGISGGRISRWTSEDGLAWSPHEQVDPGAENTLLGGFNFAGVQMVLDGDAGSRIAFQEWNLVSAPGVQGIYLRGDDGFKERTPGPSVTRLGSSDRYAQAGAIADQCFTAGANTVVIVSGEEFADALVSGPLAAVKQTPILLTRKDALPTATKDAIRSLHTRSAIIVGGPAAVSADVERELKALGLQVDRIAGRNRYDTASIVASQVAESSKSRRVLIASGEVFADGASAGAAGAVSGDPILLVSASSVPSETAAALEALRPHDRIVIGGRLRIPDAVFAQLDATERIDGQDRYEVAAAMTRWTADHGALPFRTLVTTGADFPDCLSASVAAARMRATVLLVPRSSLPTASADVLSEGRDSTIDVFVYGGPVSITDQVVGALRRTLLATRKD